MYGLTEDEQNIISQFIEQTKNIIIMNKEEIIKQYDEMLKQMETFETPEGKGKTNCYTCQSCGVTVKFLYVNSGTTPFIIRCRSCGSEAHSHVLSKNQPNIHPTYVWYRPDVLELPFLSSDAINHVLRGGLLARKLIDNG